MQSGFIVLIVLYIIYVQKFSTNLKKFFFLKNLWLNGQFFSENFYTHTPHRISYLFVWNAFGSGYLHCSKFISHDSVSGIPLKYYLHENSIWIWWQSSWVQSLGWVDSDIDNATRTIYPHGLNKKFNSKFPEGYTDWQAPEEGCRTQQSKHFDNNKDKDNGTNMSK